MVSKLSPKKVLASYLSKSLAGFFCVDPEQVEAQLVHDAKVVLKDIEIKQQRVGGLLVSGTVSEIVFSWAWDTASLITDVKLTIKGFSIHVYVVDETSETPATIEDAPSSSAATTGVDDAAMGSDWKAKYLQQIIDHLTLVVEEVNVAIHLDEGSRVVLEANGMELQTLKTVERDDATSTLLQRICLASIEARMEVEANASNFPILEPFGYIASVQRISGRRFLDGILSGLFVQGQSWNVADDSHASSTIRVHAGIQQIAGLNRLQQVLLMLGSKEPVTNVAKSIEVAQTPPSGATEMKSIFRLPFQSMELVLENGTNLRLAGCEIRYCSDGTELVLESTAGIWMDDVPVSQSNQITLDFVSSELVLGSLPPLLSSDRQETDGETFYNAKEDGADDASEFSLSVDMLRKFVVGIQAILPQCEEAMTITEQALARHNQSSASSTPPWTLRSNGIASFRFTGENDAWIRVAANAPHLTLGDDVAKTPFSFHCFGVHVESSADFSVEVPELRTEHATLVAKDRIAVNLGSIDTLNVLQRLWDQVIDIVGNSSTSGNMQIDVSLPGVDIGVESPNNGMINLSGIQGTGENWMLSTLQVRDILDVTAEAESVKVTLGASATFVYVEKVTKLVHGGTNYLSAPVLKTTLSLNRDAISLACEDLRVNCPSETTELAQEETTEALDDKPGGMLLQTLPIHFTAHQLLVLSGENSVTVEGLDIWVRKANTASIDITMKHIAGSIAGEMKGSCRGIRSSLEIQDAQEDATSLIAVPFIGKISSATTDIQNVTSLSMSRVGYLHEPSADVRIAVSKHVVSVQCKTLKFCCPSIERTTVQDNGESTQLNLSLPLCFNVQRLIAMPQFGAGKPGMCVDGIQLDMESNQEAICVRGSCNFFQGRSPNGAVGTLKGLKFNGKRSQKSDTAPSMFGLLEAGLSIKELSTLSVPGAFALSKPVLNLTIQLRNNVAEATFTAINISHFHTNDKHANNGKSQHEAAPLHFPIPFRIFVHEFVVESQTPDSASSLLSLKLKTLSMEHGNPSKGELLSLDMQCASLTGTRGLDRCSLIGLSSCLKWRTSCGNVPVDDSMFVANLGYLSSVSLQIDKCSECSVKGIGCLSQPLQSSALTYENGTLSTSIDTLFFEPSYSAEIKNSTASQISLPLNFALRLDLKRLVLVPNPAHGGIGLSLDDLLVQVKAPSDGIQGSLDVACTNFRALVKGDVGVLGRDIDVKACLEYAQAGNMVDNMYIPGIGFVSEARMNVSFISRLVLPGQGSIDQDLTGTTIAYGSDGFFITCCSVVAWNAIQTGGSAELVSSSESLNPVLFKYPIQVVAPSFKIKDDLGSILSCGKIQADVRSDRFDSSLRVKVQLDSICANRYDGANIVALEAHFEAAISPNVMESDMVVNAIPIPSVGYLHSAQCEVLEIANVILPGHFNLKSPANKLVCRFENGEISISCPLLCIQRHVAEAVSAGTVSNSSSFDLPCKANLLIDAFQVFAPPCLPNSSPSKITCSHVSLAFEPVLARIGASHESPGAGVYFKCKEFRSREGSTAVYLLNLSASGLVQFDALGKVGNLVVGIEKAQLEAEYSSVNWSGSSDKGPSAIVNLPFAVFPRFDITLKYAGKLVSIKDATISCDAFEGNKRTTVESILAHYTDIVKARIPYLLSKTSIVGADIGDSVGVMAGTLLTKTSVVGATVGVASRDAIGSAVNKGKAARGVVASEKYKFGE